MITSTTSTKKSFVLQLLKGKRNLTSCHGVVGTSQQHFLALFLTQWLKTERTGELKYKLTLKNSSPADVGIKHIHQRSEVMFHKGQEVMLQGCWACFCPPKI
jgi:hypothetical protein